MSPPRATLPGWIWIATAILLAAMLAFLWFTPPSPEKEACEARAGHVYVQTRDGVRACVQGERLR